MVRYRSAIIHYITFLLSNSLEYVLLYAMMSLGTRGWKCYLALCVGS